MPEEEARARENQVKARSRLGADYRPGRLRACPWEILPRGLPGFAGQDAWPACVTIPNSSLRERTHVRCYPAGEPGNPVPQPQPAPKAEGNVVCLMPVLSLPLASRPCRRSAGWVLSPGHQGNLVDCSHAGAPIRRIVGRLAILVLGAVRVGPAPPGIHP